MRLINELLCLSFMMIAFFVAAAADNSTAAKVRDRFKKPWLRSFPLGLIGF